MTRRTSNGYDEVAGFVEDTIAAGPSLPELLRLIAHSVDADFVEVGVDLGTGYRRDCFIEQSASIAGFPKLVRSPLTAPGDARDRRSAGPPGFTAPPRWLERRALPVGNAGRRSVPRSGVVVLRSPSRAAFRVSERRQVGLLLPQLTLSLTLACELERLRSAARHAQAALGCARLGYLLLNRDGRLLHGNALALGWLDEAGIARAPRLGFPDRTFQARYDAVLDTQRSAAPGSSIHLDLDGLAPLSFDVHTLQPESPPDAAATPRFVILLRRNADTPVLDPAAARHFDLTPAEFRLCCALARGRSLRDCAAIWHRSYETVRSQLKAVLSKTRTHRQVELVALLQRFKHR